MKALLLVSLALSTTPAFARESLCVTKAENAASFALAQELGVSVQNVGIVSDEPGMDQGQTLVRYVTVTAGNRLNRGITEKTYVVAAKQIGDSDDCTISSVAVRRRIP